MPRQTPQEQRSQILDAAAGIFAKHGPDKTTIQQVADAAGYSKAGLLYHFPSKAILQEAVYETGRERLEQVPAQVESMPIGPERDRVVVEAMVSLSRAVPGLAALMLAPLSDVGVSRGSESASSFEPHRESHQSLSDLLELAFDGRVSSADGWTPRNVRIAAALGALSVGSLVLQERGGAPELFDDLVVAACDALGHHHTPGRSTAS